MVKINFVPTRHKRRKKILKLSKGYFGSKSSIYKTANEQVMRSLQYAYRDRKQKKRVFRTLWITRINAGCVNNNMRYSRFIHGLLLAKVEINRKILSEISYNNPEMFLNYIKLSQNSLEKKNISKNNLKNVQKIENIEKINESEQKDINLIQNNLNVISQSESKKIENIEKINESEQKDINLIQNNLNVISQSESKKIENIEKKLKNTLLAELKILAKKYKIKNISKLKKIELVNYLKEIMSNEN